MMRGILALSAVLILALSAYMISVRPEAPAASDAELRQSLSESAPPEKSLSVAFQEIVAADSPRTKAPKPAQDPQAVTEARRELDQLGADQQQERIALLRKLEPYSRTDASQINRLALDELSSNRLSDFTKMEDKSSYMNVLCELYLDSSDSPEHALDDLVQVAALQSDAHIRRWVMYHFMTHYPELANRFEEAVSNRLPASTSATD